MSRRVDRINGLLREELSQLLSRQINDPRITGVITITQVQTSSDLRNARVFVSVLGNAEAKRNTLVGIQSASTYLRHELKGKLSLRYVPFMTFELDESMEDADNLLRIMDHLKETPTEDEPIGQQSDYRGPLGFSSRSN